MSADLQLITYQEAGDIINRDYIDPVEGIENTMVKSGIVHVELIPMGTGNQRRFKEVIQTDQYADDKAEGGQISQARTGTGYAKDVFARPIAKQLTVSVEFRNQGKNRKDLFNQLTDLS